MTTKVFCDGCGGEIVEKPLTWCAVSNLPGEGDDGKYIHFQRPSVHDVCKYCIIDAFKKLDDRPAAKAMRGELGDRLLTPQEDAARLDGRLRVKLDETTPQAGRLPVIMVVDVARFGNERTAIRFYGRAAGQNYSIAPPFTMMDVVTEILRIARIEKPDFVCVDPNATGAGVYDALRKYDIPLLPS